MALDGRFTSLTLPDGAVYDIQNAHQGTVQTSYDAAVAGIIRVDADICLTVSAGQHISSDILFILKFETAGNVTISYTPKTFAVAKVGDNDTTHFQYIDVTGSYNVYSPGDIVMLLADANLDFTAYPIAMKNEVLASTDPEGLGSLTMNMNMSKVSMIQTSAVGSGYTADPGGVRMRSEEGYNYLSMKYFDTSSTTTDKVVLQQINNLNDADNGLVRLTVDEAFVNGDIIGKGSLSINRAPNTTVGDGSTTEGTGCEASGNYSHAEGNGTIAASACQHVGGTFNIGDTNNQYAEIIGNGSDDSNRRNARTLDWQGNETIAGDLIFNGSTSLASALAGKANSADLNNKLDKASPRATGNMWVNNTSTAYYRAENDTSTGAAQLEADATGNSGMVCRDTSGTYHTGLKLQGSNGKWYGECASTRINGTINASSVATGTWVQRARVTISEGLWILVANCYWSSNASGYRHSVIATSSASESGGIAYQRTSATSGAVTNHSISGVANVTGNTTYYLNMYQNSGSSTPLTIGGSVIAVRVGQSV